MGALAPWHWVVLIVVIFLIFGGRLLPRLGRSFGQSITGVKKGLKEGSEQFKSAVTEDPKPPKAADGKPAESETPRSEGDGNSL